MNKKSKKTNTSKVKTEQIPENHTKILLFPGEPYEFNEKLVHYDAFGYSNGSLTSKRCALLLCDNQTNKPVESATEEIYRSVGRYYSPKVNDFVIGTIVQKTSEFYKLDIGTYTYAMLNSKDFEGATKKTKPNLNLGDAVFSRVLKTNKYDTPILSCISDFENKTWSSGESFFGNLKSGNIFDFPKIQAWRFYSDEFYAVNRLTDVVQFEIAVGMNGRIWINSDTNENIFNIYKVLMKSLTLSKDEIEKLIHDTFIDKMKID